MLAALRPAVLAAILLVAAGAARADTLYDGLGGQAGVAAIAADAVMRFMADPRIAADFDNINPDRLRARLADQICELAGGPCVYRGRSMAASHAGLAATQAKFNAVAEGLQAAMTQAGVPYWTQNRLMALLAPMQRDIVNR